MSIIRHSAACSTCEVIVKASPEINDAGIKIESNANYLIHFRVCLKIVSPVQRIDS